MRAFVAIELSDDIRSTLSQIQSHLKYSNADIKWVDKDNIHLTLKFLGETKEEALPKITQALDNACSQKKSFEISLKDIGTFPAIGNPRVIWVGIDKGMDKLNILAKEIDDMLSVIGFPKESRQFTAHLTIGRVRSLKNMDPLKQKLAAYDSKFTATIQSTSRIALFQSTLTPKGPVYTKLHESKLI